MSQINCDSCANLRESAANFIANGVTDKVADSLAENTGFNPDLEVLHENCEDLNDANDCLIGMPQKELKGFEVCDWKEFMDMYLGNNYEMLKAIIASDCGQWDKIDELLDKVSSMCAMVNATIAPPITWYGVYPNAPVGHSLGVRNTSKTTLVSGITEQYQGIGIRYGRLDVQDCERPNRTKVFEWIEPDIYYTRINNGVNNGDVLWYVAKNIAQPLINISDYMWDRFKNDPFTWYQFIIWDGASAGKEVGLELTVNPGGMGNNYIGIVYRGTTYPKEDTTSYAILPGPVSHSPWIGYHYE